MESVEQAVAKWLQYNKRHTERTQKHYQAVIESFVYSLSVRSINKITVAHLQAYINKLLNQGKKNRTANAHLTVLKSFCRWFSDQYDLPNVAVKVRNLKEDPPDARFLTNEQYLKVLESVDTELRDIIEFIAHTGLRATEFCNLTWDCVDQDHKRLVITGKGRKRRIIPLNSVCRKILERFDEPDARGVIFSSSKVYRTREKFWAKTAESKARQLKGLEQSWKHRRRLEQKDGKINRALLYLICSNAAQAAGIRIFGPHALRHWCATELLRRKVPISHVSKLLGHSSIRTTEQIYIHFQPDFLDGITECLVEPKKQNAQDAPS